MRVPAIADQKEEVAQARRPSLVAANGCSTPFDESRGHLFPFKARRPYPSTYARTGHTQKKLSTEMESLENLLVPPVGLEPATR